MLCALMEREAGAAKPGSRKFGNPQGRARLSCFGQKRGLSGRDRLTGAFSVEPHNSQSRYRCDSSSRSLFLCKGVISLRPRELTPCVQVTQHLLNCVGMGKAETEVLGNVKKCEQSNCRANSCSVGRFHGCWRACFSRVSVTTCMAFISLSPFSKQRPHQETSCG